MSYRQLPREMDEVLCASREREAPNTSERLLGLVRSIPPTLVAVVALLVIKQVVWITIFEPYLFQERTGAVLFMTSTGFSLLLATLAFGFSGRRQVGILFVSDLLLTAVGYADIVHYRQFQDLSSVASLRYAGQLRSVGDSVWGLLRWSDLWMWGDVFLLGALFFLPVASSRRAMGRRLVALSATGAVGMIALGWTVSPRLDYVFEGNAYLAGDLGIVGYHLMDASKYALHHWRQAGPSQEEVDRTQSYFTERLERIEGNPSSFHGIARGKNLIVVQLESFQDFVMDQEIDGKALTPNLRALGDESVRFTRFFSQSGKGSTADAEFVVACSLLPVRAGAVFFEYPHLSFRCLPGALQKEGYATHVFHANRPDFWNRAAIYPHLGYDRFHSSLDFEIDEVVGLGLSDDSFLRQTAEKLEDIPQPFYAFINTLTSHNPFDFPELPEPFDLTGIQDSKVSGYLRSVHYTDWALGRFVEDLREKGLLDESILVVYGDHAGITRQNARPWQYLTIPTDDEYGWTLAEKQVPLLIRLPGGEETDTRADAAGQIDLAPTLVQLLGISEKNALFLGRDLFAAAPDEEGLAIFYRESAIGDEKMYLSPDDGYGRALCLGEGGELELQECEEMREAATHWNQFSRSLLEKDLFTVLE